LRYIKTYIIAITIVIITTVIFTGCVDPYRQSYNSNSALAANSIKILLAKAYIFSTAMGVSETAKYINSLKTAFESSDLKSEEKIILTYDDEYAAIYKAENEDGNEETIVQASNRQYLYDSRSRGFYNPYRPTVFIPYPVYYERNMLNTDRTRYGTTNKTKSVRTGSSGSSFNRGGGTGFGK
jgi:hypothetical protein